MLQKCTRRAASKRGRLSRCSPLAPRHADAVQPTLPPSLPPPPAQSTTLDGKDWGWAVALWALLLAIRVAGIALLYPLCSRLGYGRSPPMLGAPGGEGWEGSSAAWQVPQRRPGRQAQHHLRRTMGRGRMAILRAFHCPSPPLACLLPFRHELARCSGHHVGGPARRGGPRACAVRPQQRGCAPLLQQPAAAAGTAAAAMLPAAVLAMRFSPASQGSAAARPRPALRPPVARPPACTLRYGEPGVSGAAVLLCGLASPAHRLPAGQLHAAPAAHAGIP